MSRAIVDVERLDEDEDNDPDDDLEDLASSAFISRCLSCIICFWMHWADRCDVTVQQEECFCNTVDHSSVQFCSIQDGIYALGKTDMRSTCNTVYCRQPGLATCLTSADLELAVCRVVDKVAVSAHQS